MPNENPKKIQNWSALISVLIGAIGIIVSSYIGILTNQFAADIPIKATQTAESRLTAIAFYETQKPTITNTLAPSTPSNTPVPSDVHAQIVELQTEVANLQQRIDSLNSSSPNSNTSLDISSLRSEIQTLDQRLSAMEQTVLDNPNKALAIPLLRRDLDTLQQNYQNDIDNTRQEVSRIYDFNKWFIGLMFTMALGIISLAVSNFVKKPEKEKPESLKPQQEPAGTRKRVKTDVPPEK